MKNVWVIEDALALIRRLQPKALECGYALSLGGGVLNAGFSWKDLDIVAVPGSHDVQALGSFLDSMHIMGITKTYVNYDHPGLEVYKFDYKGFMIDLIIPKLDKTPSPQANPLEKVNRYSS